jgi:hypothetical protein
MMLGTGAYGLLVSGAPPWTIDVFQGTALILAVAISSLTTGWGRRWSGWSRLRSVRKGPSSTVTTVPSDEPGARQE